MESNIQHKKYIQIGDVAKLFGVSVSTARVWAIDGKLKPITTLGKHRRFDLDEVNAMLMEHQAK